MSLDGFRGMVQELLALDSCRKEFKNKWSASENRICLGRERKRPGGVILGCKSHRASHLSGCGHTCELCAGSVSLGISCFHGQVVLNFAVPTSVSAFWLGAGLFPNMVHSRSVLAFIPCHPTSTCVVSFHYNDAKMSFGASLWTISPPFWNDLVVASPCC